MADSYNLGTLEAEAGTVPRKAVRVAVSQGLKRIREAVSEKPSLLPICLSLVGD